MAELSLNNLQIQINNKANSIHIHANDSNIGGPYAASSHTHSYAASSHTHTKSQITDFPTSLPANGGNADTIDGKHFSDIQSLVSSGFDAGHSLASNGYQKFSNGLIIQWGNVQRATWTNLPIAFPNECFSVVGVLGGSGSGASAGCQADATTTQVWVAYGGSTPTLHHYIAIGY